SRRAFRERMRDLITTTPAFQRLSQNVNRVGESIERMGNRTRRSVSPMREFFREIRERGNAATRELADGSRRLRISLDDLESVFPRLTRSIRTVTPDMDRARHSWRKFTVSVAKTKSLLASEGVLSRFRRVLGLLRPRL